MSEVSSRPSAIQQLGAVIIGPDGLMPAARNYNPGLLRYAGRIWMSYRSHLPDDGRCALAICELVMRHGPFGTKLIPKHGQWLNIQGPNGCEHHEDSRLFLFNGIPHIAFSETNFYPPPKPYTCSIKYARLRLEGDQWSVERIFTPRYGRNDGHHIEKNWQFFERAGALHCIYEGTPNHIVLRLDGEAIVETYTTKGPEWPWGIVRGGTPPIPYDENHFITFFHSSGRTELQPHYCRYYGAAYIFENKPPFEVKKISSKYMMVGSEMDGHAPDPRKADGWKPYVVFPCGCITAGDGWMISLGVNDWRSAIAHIKPEQLSLTAADGSDRPFRYFKTPNGSRPERVIELNSDIRWVQWRQARITAVGAAEGFLETRDPMLADELSGRSHILEITREEYPMLVDSKRRILVG